MLAVRNFKRELVKSQLSLLLGCDTRCIEEYQTPYPGIALINLGDAFVTRDVSIRNIEALPLDDHTFLNYGTQRRLMVCNRLNLSRVWL